MGGVEGGVAGGGRYRPVLRDGRPIAVDYAFNVRLVLR